MKKTGFLFVASILAMAVVLVVVPTSIVSVAGDTGSFKSCADITFGTGLTDSTTVLALNTSGQTFYSTTNISVSSVEINTGYAVRNPGTQYAARIGAKAAAKVTFTFDYAYVITGAYLYAAKYNSSDSDPTLTVTTSANETGVDQALAQGNTSVATDNLTNAVYFPSLGNSGCTSFSVATTYRFYLEKIVFVINGSSTPVSSSASSSSAATSTVSSIASSAASSSESTVATGWPTSSGTYRVSPTNYSSATSAPVYNVTSNGSAYTGTQITTISKAQDCLTYEQVALYYQAFRQAPPNYVTSKTEAVNYGLNGRVLSKYHKYGSGAYTGSNDYSTAFGTFNDTTVGDYWEFDIDATGSYNTGTITRGACRLVIVLKGLTDYGSEPVCFFTLDHYADFMEFYNFKGGWGKMFAGVSNGSNTSITSATRFVPTTVNFTIA